ncbi:leucine-rich repeat receptor protein kinase EMS1 [Telopea speciosissima]|uniref:leucine-rich repeat receptor protein kinase EMS1 n=1 Tax=Telopea speciosissima TaxID=54955 RepID=UPI001CC6AAF4|nr:leucine-rich repeat receptor protein kinase EMS1 [Telopea speciosissima]
MEPTVQALLAASASFFIVTLIFALICFLCRLTTKPNTQTRSRTIPEPRNVSSSINIDESATFDPSLQISMTDLVVATRNFATDGIIGDGSFGLVYKACLSDGATVAVKKLSEDAFQGLREFHAEMETLGKIRHPNLVKILGYCVSGTDRILIYEFIERGSLDQWLQDTSPVVGDVSWPLPWETRTKIIKGVALGLSFLHGLETPIIHRDIKASNVLLDLEFEAHIADFGLARRVKALHSHVSTQVAGTMGYMPPEYKAGVTLATLKADVYSFGILMLEVATGRRPNWPVKMDNGREVGLIEWAVTMVAEDRQIDMIDKSLSTDGLKEDEIREFLRIACLCTSEMSRERPSMEEVVTMLESLCGQCEEHKDKEEVQDHSIN